MTGRIVKPENRERKLTDDQALYAQLCRQIRETTGTLQDFAQECGVPYATLLHALTRRLKGTEQRRNRTVQPWMMERGLEILRTLRATPTCGQLARVWNVHQAVVERVSRGVTYKHVRPPGGFVSRSNRRYRRTAALNQSAA
jgi:hypothetical protein